MATVSLLGSVTINTNAGAKTVTATPSANDLIVIVVYHSDSDYAAWSNPTDNNSSGTYSAVKLLDGAGSKCCMGVYVRNTKISSATSTVFTAPAPPSPTLDTGGGLAVFKITGMSRYGMSAVKQSASDYSFTSNISPSISFTSNKLTSNPVIGGLMCVNEGYTIGPTTGYTEAFDTSYTTPSVQCEGQFISSGDSTNSMDWTGTISTSGNGIAGVMIGVEFDASPLSSGNFFLCF